MSETTFFKSLHCPRRKETAPKAGTAGFSRLNNNLELITANLCSRGLAALSCTSKKLNGIATNAVEQRLVQLIQNKEITGIQASIEDMTKNQLTAIIFLQDNNIIDINEKDMYGRQLLHRCFVYNQVALTRALIAARANVDVQDPFTDYTLLYMAAHIGCKAIVYDLLDVKAKLDVKNLSGETPLQIAQINNNKEIIDILTKKSGEKDLYCNIL